jgi:hypothetical protein
MTLAPIARIPVEEWWMLSPADDKLVLVNSI